MTTTETTKVNYHQKLRILAECDESISHPGKFEGEKRYVPFFYGVYLDGFSDSDNGHTIEFNISQDDIDIFPELDGKTRIALAETNSGFIIEVEPEDPEDPEDQPSEPEPQDFCLSVSGHLGCRFSVSIYEGEHIGEYVELDDAMEAIRSHMDSDQYWPNIWFENDHGNIDLIDSDGNSLTDSD